MVLRVRPGDLDAPAEPPYPWPAIPITSNSAEGISSGGTKPPRSRPRLSRCQCSPHRPAAEIAVTIWRTTSAVVRLRPLVGVG